MANLVKRRDETRRRVPMMTAVRVDSRCPQVTGLFDFLTFAA